MDHDGAPSTRPQTLILPKTQRSSDLLFVDQLLVQIEARRGLDRASGLEALVEDATGMLNISDIAAACERLETLIFGMGDFAASQRIDTLNIGDQGGYAGDLWHYPRYQLIMAARAHGLEPIDGPYANFKDGIGHAGRLHGSQVPWDDRQMGDPSDQIAPITTCLVLAWKPWHKRGRNTQLMRRRLAQGLGAVSVDGVMVDQGLDQARSPLIGTSRAFGLVIENPQST